MHRSGDDPTTAARKALGDQTYRYTNGSVACAICLLYRALAIDPSYAPAAGLVEAPDATASNKQVQEDEAIEDRRSAAVDRREKTARRVRHEMGDRHVARQDERDGAGKQAKND